MRHKKMLLTFLVLTTMLFVIPFSVGMEPDVLAWELPLHILAGADKDSYVITFETPTLEIRPPNDGINQPNSSCIEVTRKNIFGEYDWSLKLDVLNPTSISRLPECFVTDNATGETYYDSVCDPTPSYIEPDEDFKIVVVPYSPIAESIEINRINSQGESDKVLAVVDVRKDQDFCGDGKCSNTESYLWCPDECMEEEIRLEMKPWLAESDQDTNDEFGQKFRQTHIASNIEISSNEITNIYVEKGHCSNSLFICVESEEDTDPIGVFYPKNSVTGKTLIDTFDESGNQKSSLMASNGLGIRVSGDWPSNPKVAGNNLYMNGRKCTQGFDPTAQPPVSQTCT